MNDFFQSSSTSGANPTNLILATLQWDVPDKSGVMKIPMSIRVNLKSTNGKRLYKLILYKNQYQLDCLKVNYIKCHALFTLQSQLHNPLVTSS